MRWSVGRVMVVARAYAPRAAERFGVPERDLLRRAPVHVPRAEALAAAFPHVLAADVAVLALALAAEELGAADPDMPARVVAETLAEVGTRA